MDRGKIVAIITGVISILLAFAYLIIVQILDFRGEMKPAPISQVETQNVNFVNKSFGVTLFHKEHFPPEQTQTFTNELS